MRKGVGTNVLHLCFYNGISSGPAVVVLIGACVRPVAIFMFV